MQGIEWLGFTLVFIESVEIVESIDVEVAVIVPRRKGWLAKHGCDIRSVPSTFDEHVRVIWTAMRRNVPSRAESNLV